MTYTEGQSLTDSLVALLIAAAVLFTIIFSLRSCSPPPPVRYAVEAGADTIPEER